MLVIDVGRLYEQVWILVVESRQGWNKCNKTNRFLIFVLHKYSY